MSERKNIYISVITLSFDAAAVVIPATDCMDAGGTSPWTGEGRTMQEQLSRATQDAKAEAEAGIQIISSWIPASVSVPDSTLPPTSL